LLNLDQKVTESKKSNESAPNLSPCLKQQAENLAMIKAGAQDLFVVKCNKNGDYATKQYVGYPVFKYYCVDAKTGEKVENNSCLAVQTGNVST